MSNVHTLGDLQNNNNQPGPAYGRIGQQQNQMGMAPMDEESKQAMGMFGGLTGQGGNIGKLPREENYWDMWKSTFCPQFTVVSFTFLIWLVNTAAYVATLFMAVSPNKELNDKVFLGPDLYTLHAWGALDAYEIQQNYQVWRLFTSLFLSLGFSQYVISSGTLLVIGFMVENPKMSPIRMALLYFLAGILGNLFSVCVKFEVSVGCFPSVMGLVAALLAGVIVNWKALAGAGMLRICIIFMTVMLFVIILILSSSQPFVGE